MAQFSANFQTKTTSAWTDAWTFTVAPQIMQTSLVTLEITTPSTCSGVFARYSFAGISDEPIGANRFTFHLAAVDGAPSPVSSVEISVDGGSAISGTMGGSFGGLSVTSESGARATLAGQLNREGTMSGTFAGSIAAFVNPRVPPLRCTSTAFAWSIRPRG